MKHSAVGVADYGTCMHSMTGRNVHINSIQANSCMAHMLRCSFHAADSSSDA